MYDNETTASKLPHGLTAISVLLQVGDMSNVEMRKITKAARNIRYGGRIKFLNIDFSSKQKDILKEARLFTWLKGFFYIIITENRAAEYKSE